MSFLDRAKMAAAQTADQAKRAAEQARTSIAESTERAQASLSDPTTADKARQAMTRVRRGVATAIDRIDPGVLADVVIKATALQERTNGALKTKGSPYRISEVAIGAAIPPSITFSITRMDDPEADAVPEGAIASVDLLADVVAGGDNGVQALDGTTVDEAILGDEPT